MGYIGVQEEQFNKDILLIKQIGLGLVHKLYEGDNVGILHMKSSEFKMSLRNKCRTSLLGFVWLYYISTLKTELHEYTLLTTAICKNY